MISSHLRAAAAVLGAMVVSMTLAGSPARAQEDGTGFNLPHDGLDLMIFDATVLEGTNGLPGDQGIQGLKGVKGDTGLTGVPGADGEDDGGPLANFNAIVDDGAGEITITGQGFLTEDLLVTFDGEVAVNLSARDVVAVEGTPLGAPEVALHHDLLTVQAIDVPLAELLRTIGEKAGFQVIVRGDLGALVTWSFADVPVEEALRRVLHKTSSVTIYARAQDGGTGPVAKIITFHRNVDLAAGQSRVVRMIPAQETEVSQGTPVVSLSDDREDR